MPYKELRAEHIIGTAETLRNRVGERFPGRGISGLSSELVSVTEELSERADRMGRPFYLLRLTSLAVTTTGLVGLGVVIWQNLRHFQLRTEDLSHFEGLEAVLNMMILIAAGIWFFLNLEARIKRGRILDDLHVLRSLAHVIDMHQLTKDPSGIVNSAPKTRSSPVRDMQPYELLRYLDYLSEMLSLIGKVAALYLERVNDSEVNRSVNEIEDLTSNLSRKIWQKIGVIEASEIAADPTPLSAVNL